MPCDDHRLPGKLLPPAVEAGLKKLFLVSAGKGQARLMWLAPSRLVQKLTSAVEPGFPLDSAAEADRTAGLPFINMEFANPDDFKQFTEKTFATDRDLVPKGMIEVIL